MLGISYIRELFNLSMTDLAGQLGVSKQVISQYEGGKTRISDKRVKQISDMFKIPTKYIAKELTELDKLEMQKAKLNNGIEEYEFDEIILDEETEEERRLAKIELEGDELLNVYMKDLQIEEQKLFENIKKSLEQCFVRGQQCSVDSMNGRFGGVIIVSEVLSLCESFLKIIDNPNVYMYTLENILTAINIAYGNNDITTTTDKFVKKIVKAIKDYDEKNEKEWEKVKDLFPQRDIKP